MVLPKCPNCKRLYKFYKSDDETYYYMLKHDTAMCPQEFNIVAYHDLQVKRVEIVREEFKKSFPWLYKKERAKLS